MRKSYYFITLSALFFSLSFSFIAPMNFTDLKNFLWNRREKVAFWAAGCAAYVGSSYIGCDIKKPLNIALAFSGLGLGWKWLSHNKKLDAIRYTIDISKESGVRTEGKFKFATWRIGRDNSYAGPYWETAHDIFRVRKLGYLQSALASDLENNRLETIKTKNRFTAKTSIKNEIDSELKQWEEWLIFVASLTNMPQRIITVLEQSSSKFKSLERDNITIHEKLCSIAQAGFFYKDNVTWELVKSAVSYESHHTSENQQKIFRATMSGLNNMRKELIYIPSWWRMWQWRLIPCYKKASELYIKIYQYYIRLCALRSIIGDSDFQLELDVNKQSSPRNSVQVSNKIAIK